VSVWCVFQETFVSLAVIRGDRGQVRRCASFAVPVLAAATLLAGLSGLHAQEAPADDSKPKEEIRFRLYRWQEDYLWLSRKTEPLSDYERLKYIPLSGAPTNYLSLGGELRYRLDSYDPYLFGLGASGKPGVRTRSGSSSMPTCIASISEPS